MKKGLLLVLMIVLLSSLCLAASPDTAKPFRIIAEFFVSSPTDEPRVVQ